MNKCDRQRVVAKEFIVYPAVTVQQPDLILKLFQQSVKYWQCYQQASHLRADLPCQT